MPDTGAGPYTSPEARREQGVVWGAVVAVLAATVLLAGVLTVLTGDDADDVDGVALLAAAPDAAIDAGTARIEMSAEITGGPMSMDMSGDGLVDFATGASSLTMSMFGTEMELRTLDGHAYMRLPDVGRPPGLDASWIGMPMTAGNPSVTGTPNAAAMLDSLRGMGNDVDELGREEVNGQDADGFRVTIDLQQAAAQVPESERARVQESVEQMRAIGMTEWPMEVWVNDDGLPVRMVMEMERLGGTDASMRMQVDYLDFGLPVEIEAPPADDTVIVQDVAEIQELLSGAGPEAA